MRQLALNSLSGLFGGIVAFLFGTWNPLLSLFIIAIAIDYISGIAASLREGKGLSSEVGFWGLTRKGLMLFIVILAHHVDTVFGTVWIREGAISFYLANELVSIVENYGRLGLPLPPKLRKFIASLKNNEDKQ
ncbi:holin [Paenibacillus dendritiformis]|uniref:phage holin family protein n=1 Tax=Paenibacillus dendritiformis TaxID=130049 RepID=UPI0018CD9E17|nr:phage holin family protein [Paenibacillus dendritiformis]MBG9793240.1 holin [Paenibacillus dendritiformis]